MKRLISVLAVLIALAVCLCIPAHAEEPANKFQLYIINHSNIKDTVLFAGVGETVTLRLYARQETLTSDSVNITYEADHFMLQSTDASTSGITVTHTDNTADGIVNISYTVQQDPANDEVEICTLKFKNKDTAPNDAYRTFMMQANTQDETLTDSVKVNVNHNHTFSNWTYSVQPSATEDGEQVRTCKECAFKETKVAPALSYTLQIKNDATQIQYDLTEDVYYAICPGCTVEELLAKFNYSNTVKVLDAKGAARNAKDIICTNDKIAVYSATNTLQNEALLSVYGDTDGDGKIQATDARNALRASVNLFTGYTKAVYYAMDSDSNNTIQASDARFLLRTSVSLDAFYPVEATAINLNKTNLTLYTGLSETLTATLTPDNVSVPSVTWTSSNDKIASVSSGKITGVAPGTCTITAAARNGIKATCTVTVKQSVEKITQTRKNVYLLAGGSADLSQFFTIAPQNADLSACQWTVSNTAFSVVNGIVKCTRNYTDVADKVCTVTYKTPNNKQISFNVTLLPADAKYCQINREYLSVPVGQTFNLKNTAGAGVIAKYTSDNTAVVRVNEDNTLTALKTGTAKITCSTATYTSSCIVTVKSNALHIKECGIDRNDGSPAFVLSLTNTSGKDIASLLFYVTGYTASGAVHEDAIYCRIDNIPADEDDVKVYKWSLDKLWDNTTAVYSASVIKEITIKYKDGTQAKLTADQLYFGP